MLPEAIRFDIANELSRQDDKWGKQNHTPDRWLVIIGEEFGEACEASLLSERARLRDELIQVAASAVAAIECLDA